MSYAVKEIFYTLQGEGAHSGRPAVFCRFAGCNLWSGREADRATAVCRFCDTDFVGTDGPGGGRFADAQALAEAVAAAWPSREFHGRYVVCTGGEPLLQLDAAAVAALRERGFDVAVETNATLPLPPGGVDWVCVSPKAGSEAQWVLREGDELKLVYPQPRPGAEPERFAPTQWRFTHYYLQPQDVPGNPEATQANLRAATNYCLANPRFKLSLQTHKLLGIP